MEEQVSGNLVIAFYCLYLGVLFGGLWKVFEKAGHPGWMAIVPVLNFVIMLKIARRPLWFLLLLLIPLVNIYVICATYSGIAKAFGRDPVAYTVGLLFLPPVFFAILGFGEARYLGNRLGSQ